MAMWRIKDIIQLDIDEHNYFTINIPVPYPLIGIGLNGSLCLHAQLSPTNCQHFHLFNGVNAVWQIASGFSWHIEELLAGKHELAPERLRKLGAELIEHVWDMRHDRLTDWDGWNYQPLSSRAGDPAMWLYACKNTIYLEITPTYKHENYKIPFKVFMRNYRPYFVKILTTEQLLYLRDQAKAVADLMLANKENPALEGVDYERRRPKDRPPAHCIRPLEYAAQHPTPPRDTAEESI